MKPFAKKSLGQNFLVDNNYIEKIIDALSLTNDDTVIEIGPGRGALTERLVESGAKIVAVEIDDHLVPFLKDKFAENDNFSIVHEDALELDLRTLVEIGCAKLVANLPYYISTAILQRLIEQRECLSEMVLMLQREVVNRITAEPGNSDRGFLTVLVEGYMKGEKLFDVPPSAFRPAPKVWSSIVRLAPKQPEEIGPRDEKLFRRLVSAGFAYKRKTILNNFKSAPPDLKEKMGDANEFLERNEIDPKRRAETLTFAEWKRLNEALS